MQCFIYLHIHSSTITQMCSAQLSSAQKRRLRSYREFETKQEQVPKTDSDSHSAYLFWIQSILSLHTYIHGSDLTLIKAPIYIRAWLQRHVLFIQYHSSRLIHSIWNRNRKWHSFRMQWHTIHNTHMTHTTYIFVWFQVYITRTNERKSHPNYIYMFWHESLEFLTKSFLLQTLFGAWCLVSCFYVFVLDVCAVFTRCNTGRNWCSLYR